MGLTGEEKPVVVVGLGRSGVAAAAFLARRGTPVVATDRRTADELRAESDLLAPLGVRLELGGHRRKTFTGAAGIVVSPGVPSDLPELEAARAAGIAVVAEIELAFRHLRGRLAAITGTKGKSTTTAALGAMLSAAGADVRVGGNIGEALVGLVEGSTPETIFAVEVSSFQLEGISTFRPDAAVFLNLAEDHLDRHPSFAAYAAAKARIFENQSAEDWAVLNADDPQVLALARRIRARRLLFRPSGSPAPEGDAAFFEDGEARLRRDGQTETLFALPMVQLPGAHLAGDLLAAAATARVLGTPPAAIARAVESFRGAAHVLEHVATIDGIDYYNDSKATNVLAARRSLESFTGPVLLLLGGRYKGGEFADLAPLLRLRGKAVLAIGEARERIVASLGSTVPVQACGSLREAVERAHALATAGDTVLLAPACSSFDMFQDYGARGRAFKDEVRRLAAPLESPGENEADKA